MPDRKPTKRPARKAPAKAKHAAEPKPVEQRRHLFFGPPNEANVVQAVEAVRTTEDHKPTILLVPDSQAADARKMAAGSDSLQGVFEAVLGSDFAVGTFAIDAEPGDA